MPVSNQPAPNPQFSAYERTTQSLILDGVTGNQAQVGSAAPVAAFIYGMVGVVSRGQLPYNLVIQIDVSGGTLSGAPVFTLLGSLDNVHFYSLGTIAFALTGGIYPFSGIFSRYISGSLAGYAVASGTPAVTVSMSA